MCARLVRSVPKTLAASFDHLVGGRAAWPVVLRKTQLWADKNLNRVIGVLQKREPSPRALDRSIAECAPLRVEPRMAFSRMNVVSVASGLHARLHHPLIFD